ncbi:SDR family oxidoreductase [Arthrobacter sp. 2RAF6]|uniref:SDR family oxidoreductase n=1 Tax=Arthrobacter sp. 2RAF6 TaxID=3233002 RepID=UPI003F935DC5
MTMQSHSKVAVVTGVGRRRSIGANLAVGLARDGWDLALNYWRPYDDRVGLERNPDDPESIASECRALRAAVELAGRGVRANVVNPGPIDTGWMDDATRRSGIDATPAGRLGTAEDTTDLVRFLFSERGSWMNGQILYSNGGFKVD